MADPPKPLRVGGGGKIMSDLKSLFSIMRTRRTMWFVYGFMFTFVAFTAFLAFCPSDNTSSPWFNNIFSSDPSNRSQFSSFFSYLFPNSSQPIVPTHSNTTTTSFNFTSNITTNTPTNPPPQPSQPSNTNQTQNLNQPQLNQTQNIQPQPQINETVKSPPQKKNETVIEKNREQNRASSYTGSVFKERNITSGNSTANTTESVISKKKDMGKSNSSNSMEHCDIFDGNWVRDDAYPLYPPGSCSLIDEQFNCFRNGRPDKEFQKYRWQPKGCNIPRLNGRDMLELLRGKRLVFVGDSLNRNMWESLVCILRNSVSDKSKVFEASGRKEFRTDNSYLFIFKDYNCTVEFFRSPFLVQEWEMPEINGTTKETLRLDLVEKSSTKYKDADIIVFNTGHWWTHEKTSKGKDYYQEGSHVYGELNVVEAFRKALTTWARWVDVNVNPKKTHVLFRGYSASHFSGGQWNSGGQCDDETEPIKNDTYLTMYPPKMRVLESVLKGMKNPVSYLNITRMTDYRKDGHPSVFRKQNVSEEERRSPLRFQDCSHWCLPGVPDSWNELLYAQLLIKQMEKQQHQEQLQKHPKKQP